MAAGCLASLPTPYLYSRPHPHPLPDPSTLDLTFAPTCNQLLSSTSRISPAASSQQPAEPPPPPSQWGLPEPQDFAAHRAAPRRAVCGGSPVLAPVARHSALPGGATCGGCNTSTLENAFAGSSGSSLEGAFAGTGNSDARQLSTSARFRRQSFRCSPNPFSAPALRAPVDAVLRASEGGFERADSDLDFDAAFSGVPSWF